MRTPALSLLIPTLLALPACASDATGDGSACTTVGCSDGLEVAFVASSWPAGSYRLDVTADGRAYDCETTLPFEKDAPVRCSSSDVMLMISGTELPDMQQAITAMHLFVLAETVEVTLSRDGFPLATQTFHPVYATLQPNGPACEPTCRVAAGSMQL